jgi:hypothetical protein
MQSSFDKTLAVDMNSPLSVGILTSSSGNPEAIAKQVTQDRLLVSSTGIAANKISIFWPKLVL